MRCRLADPGYDDCQMPQSLESLQQLLQILTAIGPWTPSCPVYANIAWRSRPSSGNLVRSRRNLGCSLRTRIMSSGNRWPVTYSDNHGHMHAFNCSTGHDLCILTPWSSSRLKPSSGLSTLQKKGHGQQGLFLPTAGIQMPSSAARVPNQMRSWKRSVDIHKRCLLQAGEGQQDACVH